MINDKALRKVLQTKIDSIKTYPKSVQKKVEIEMARRYNVKFGDVVDIFNGIKAINDVEYDMLFKLSKSIYEVAVNSDQRIDSSDLFAEKYFTEQEIVEFDRPYPDEEKDFDLEITDWKQISDTKIKIFTNINEVIKWRNFNKLRFNPETQRDLITIYSSGKKTKQLDINRNAVKEMKVLMKKGVYYNVCGILNINPEISPIPYKEGRNLIIPKEAHIDLIEGFHNFLAETELKDEDPDFEYEIEFDLMLLNTEQANDLIIQMDKKTHFKPAQVTRIDRFSEINYIVNTLNTRSTYHLNSTIDNDMKTHLNKLLTALYGVITERQESLELLIELESDLNYIVETYKHFKPFNRKEYFIYIGLSKYAKGKGIKFSDLLSSIDISNVLENLNIYEPTPKNLKTFNKYIEEVTKNVL